MSVPVVTFRSSGRKLAWNSESGCLLEFAEENGIFPDHACRAGSCRTCETAYQGQGVETVRAPVEPARPGHLFLCCSRPTADIELDL